MSNYKTLLAIDDESDVCDLLKEYFEKKGHEVMIAHSGEKGLQIILEYRPEFVFLDLALKDISGIEVLQQLKHLSIFSRVIMITGINDVEKMSMAYDLGVEAYLIKPIELSKLEAIVNDV